MGFPGGLESKEFTCNAEDLGLIPRLGRSPGGGHGNPLQDLYLENPMDRGAWQVTVHGVAESDKQPCLCEHNMACDLRENNIISKMMTMKMMMITEMTGTYSKISQKNFEELCCGISLSR